MDKGIKFIEKQNKRTKKSNKVTQELGTARFNYFLQVYFAMFG